MPRNGLADMWRKMQAQPGNFAVNGRFLTQATSGVQRYARELLSAYSCVRSNQSRSPANQPVMLVPQTVWAAENGAEAFGAFKLRPVGMLKGHAWEQVELRYALGEQFLVNLCNTAPLNRRNQLVVIHDAAVWRHPEAYSPAFCALYRTIQPHIARKSRMLVTVSCFSAGELMRCLNLAARSIEIIPNSGDHILRIPPDLSILCAHRLEPGRYLLAVGSANPTKNHAFLRHLVPFLSAHQLPLVIAGGKMSKVFAEGEETDDSCFRHLGYISDGALRTLYENAMGFIFPSLYEGFGVPPLEAMHCGCPVLAARAAAIPETCAGAALYFDPSDPRSLIESCRRFIASPQLRQELQAAGRNRASQFSWAESSKLLAALLAGR